MKLAEPQTNPNWRNWYLVAANELRGIFPKADSSAVAGGLTSPGIVDALPYGTWVNQWTLRLKAEETIRANTNTGAIKVYGGTEVEVQAFFRYFDAPLRYLPPLAAR
jgi:alkyl sulfatase BDS1-like metallo-beta-lactamase superfamily hydrolase